MTVSETAAHYHPWSTYIAAREEAHRFGDRKIGTDHLVLGLLRDPEIEKVLGVSLSAARSTLIALDVASLEAVGLVPAPEIPLREERPLPQRPTAREVLRERIRLTPAATTALRQAGKPIRRGHHIRPQAVLLALLENHEPDPAASLLSALKIDQIKVRRELEAAGT